MERLRSPTYSSKGLQTSGYTVSVTWASSTTSLIIRQAVLLSYSSASWKFATVQNPQNWTEPTGTGGVHRRGNSYRKADNWKDGSGAQGPYDSEFSKQTNDKMECKNKTKEEVAAVHSLVRSSSRHRQRAQCEALTAVLLRIEVVWNKTQHRWTS